MKPDVPKTLRHGYTTGACAAAATKGASQMLRDQRILDEVEICLPGGEAVTFRLHGQRLTETGATCYIVKDAGDDPDVTNGAEIHATVDVKFFTDPVIIVRGGEGVGRVTKPGLAVPVGEWAINPVPRNMIITGVKEALAMRCVPATLTVTISIPGGEELAKKTLNERLGIVGGLSILGTTGIVRPVSVSAWIDTIDCALDVAMACNAPAVVLSTGRTSELVAQKHFSGQVPLQEEAYVMMGDHVGHALRSAAARGVPRVVIAGQFAKLLKIACGHEQTHVSSSELDLQLLAKWCSLEPRTSNLEPLARKANTARQVLVDSGNDADLINLVCSRAQESAGNMAPGLQVGVLLAGYGGEVLYFA
ncbi:MAG TPA: cobalt-precorrin-5B (C(1))-methyltransferase [Geobacteraceae bacterium]|nr:cobalt-precorrin-5B (C(1))-methyltransferase [Geobacteraceae bacterium]